MLKFETEDRHLNLEDTLIEIRVLYEEYGLEDDKNLTNDAILLKIKILEFVNAIKSF